MAFQTDLLRAPSRKRKPECAITRRPRIVKMTWDVDTDRTQTLLQDLGVARLPDSDTEEDNAKHTKSDDYVPTLVSKETVLPTNPHIQTLGPCGVYLSQLSPPLSQCDVIRVNDASWLMRKPLSARHTCTTDPWNKLSDEMVLNVFKWLPKTTLVRCQQVCRRWNRLGLDETLWRRLDLSNKTLNKGEMGTVLDRGVAVLRLAKATIYAPIYHSVSQEAEQRFSKVQFLDLSMSSASPGALEQVIGSCHILRKLSLENCTINNAVCRAIGQNRHLEVLNLNMCEGITENGLVPICNSLQKLDALNIGWTNMSKGAVVYLVICLSRSLTKLNLAGCRETLEDDDVHQLCSSCPNLKELDLSDATLLTGTTVEYMAMMLRGLEYVALSRCYHVMPSFLPLLAHIPTLLALDVFGMLKESAVHQLREAMPNIEVNKFPFTSIARPTTGVRRTSIWGLRVRDSNV